MPLRLILNRETMMSRTRLTVFRTISLILLACFLQACKPADEASSKPEGSPASISGYNYTIEGIQEFSVNGQWGGNLGIGDGGGSNVCCVMLPKKWQPGLTAEVEWRRSDCGFRDPENERCPSDINKEWHFKTLKKTVPIDFYDRPYGIYVAFLPNDEVKIYVTLAGLDNPEHPAKLGRARPLDHPEWKRPEE